MIIDNIIETYYKYREMVIGEYKNPKHLQVVIKITPRAFTEIRAHENIVIFKNNGIFYIELLGRKTPIIIKDNLPNNVEFIMQSQIEYEREEQQKLFYKFNEMFNNDLF